MNKGDSILSELQSHKQLKKINLSQDFVDEVLYYGVKLNQKIILINSKKEIISLEELKAKGLSPINESLEKSSFTGNDAFSYINSNCNLNLNELFNDVNGYIKRFAFFKDHRLYSFVTLWVLGTYVFKIFKSFP